MENKKLHAQADNLGKEAMSKLEGSKSEEELKRQRDEDEVKKETVEPAKKKKKFLGKTNFVNDDEYEDILESGWFYLDSSNNPQGPFTSKEMKEWFIAGFFFESTMVRRIKETDYTSIMEREEFKQCDISSTVVSTDIYHRDDANTKSVHSGFGADKYDYFHADESLTEKTDGYAQAAFFTDNGKFMPTNSYYASRGIPEDRAGRMLAHYLDVDAYQDKMRAAKAHTDGVQRPKVTKKMVEAFKKKKVDKQRRRILQM